MVRYLLIINDEALFLMTHGLYYSAVFGQGDRKAGEFSLPQAKDAAGLAAICVNRSRDQPKPLLIRRNKRNIMRELIYRYRLPRSWGEFHDDHCLTLPKTQDATRVDLRCGSGQAGVQALHHAVAAQGQAAALVEAA